MGTDYTLLRFDGQVDVSPLQDAARKRGVPLKVVDVASVESSSLYPQSLVLSRPDQHIAWRGNAMPSDPLALIDVIRGARAAVKEAQA
jgi:hypothetical protein